MNQRKRKDNSTRVKSELWKEEGNVSKFWDLKPSIFDLFFLQNKCLYAACLYAIDHSKSNNLILTWLFLNFCFRNLENENLLDSLIPTDGRLSREASELNCLIWVQGEIRSRIRLVSGFQKNKMLWKDFANPSAL